MQVDLARLGRIAIVNRGEPAMRAIHAIRELRHEHGLELSAIALHTDAERDAMFAREADDAVTLTSAREGIAYLDLEALEAALVRAAADSVWVGWGFVAERPEFADLCEALGITFVGPSGDVMRALGDKIGAKLLAERAGVPVAPWSGGPVDDVESARTHAERIGFPLVVKAAAGGGGRGIRLVRDPETLPEAFERAREEARRAFGDATVFLEQLVTGARHIEVQVIADDHGTVWTPGVRDCSVQRRNQKVLEESSSTALDDDQARELAASAASLVRLADYRNAGTVEFLYQPEARRFAFLEVNTRLQVEHPVTELTTGIDLVKLQLLVAAGGRLPGDSAPATEGHAIEVRLNAEDVERGFAPAPGRIERLTLPAGPGIRVDTGVSEGDTIPPEYDSMIAKIIAHGRDRGEALARLSRALAQTAVLVRGGTTNRAFLLDLLSRPELEAGGIDTGWLDRLAADGGWTFDTRADVALVAAAVDAHDANEQLERDRFYASAARGRPQAPTDSGVDVDLRHAGTAYRLRVWRTDRARYLVELDGVRVAVEVEPLRPFERRLTVAGHRFRIASITHGHEQLVEVDGVPHRVSQDDAGLVRAPGPSVVVAITVEPGDLVEAGSSVAVLESMKMESVLAAPFTGRVREVLTTGNVQLDAGAPIVRLEPIGDDEEAATGERASLEALAVAAVDGGGEARASEAIDTLRRLVLGYDVPSLEVPVLLDELADDPDGDQVRAELRVLRLFADLSSLTRNRRIGDAEDHEQSHSAREYLHAYLRSLDADAEGLPDSFRDKLRTALTEYGVDSLDRTAALEEALFRVYVGQQRAGVQVPAILRLLERRMQAPPDEGSALADELRDTLDGLVVATQVRHPVVGDLARRVRYRAFDQPRLIAEREAVYDQVREHVIRLSEGVGPGERDERMAALVATPQPLLGMLADGVVEACGPAVMLEVLTRRYYRTRELHGVHTLVEDGHDAVVADYTDRRGRGRVVAVAGTDDRLDEILAVTGRLAGTDGDVLDAGVVVDLYVSRSEVTSDVDALSTRLAAALDRAALPADVRRITLSVTSPTDTDTRHEIEHLTFRREGSGFAERTELRGIHPLIAGRLNLWRLERFHLVRKPSSDDVYLFEATARETPDDRRLVVLAEVRDLTPVRDASGEVRALPELERVLAACLDDLRQARAAEPEDRRPEWNRVLLNVWPVVRLTVPEVHGVIRAIAPMTEGLGLEQITVQARMASDDGEPRPVTVRMSRPPGQGLSIRVTEPPTTPLEPFDALTQKILRARRRGAVHPFEIVPRIVRSADGADHSPAEGSFVEHDLDEHGRLVPVDRPWGSNEIGVVVGVVTTPTARYPEGMTRVAILSDPTRRLGSIAVPECRSIVAALDLADELGVPVEWFAVSSGAHIAMDSGTENMDGIAQVLRRIIEFTQSGGEINVIVTGINVGAQPYFNAEATMLMHTRGILVMTPDSAMVLTGKQALDYSGGVSAEDNFGIGGYDRVMGPNGQAQYWAPDLAGACDLLFAHYAHSYVAPGERFPRRATSEDPIDRDVRDTPHVVDGLDFTTVGEVFSDAANPGRKKPFDIRTLLRAVADADHPLLERWADMADAETAVAMDAHLGGHPVALIGFESRPLPRRGLLPADGPEQWSAGTLFPRSSKKTARAINAASGNRPLVVLANLSGFDGSPESLRQLQLEFGAEIGRAVVNFDGPIVFCVVSRYHGGAFVVFSAALNDDMEVTAVEGAHASVIGGPPAAAVVFAGEVNRRTDADPRVAELSARIAATGDEAEAARLGAELDALRSSVRSEKLGEVAEEFDRVHSVERALEVGSVHRIIPAATLRPYLVDAVQRGIDRVLERHGARR
jgi:acetyl/propionyl-CoA carboxylase alpha subunit/acetyl-CoA carboxylase carboxyltransferase component